ncbi:MAG: Bug family tripartite tricarboxylate transporter substrate binding protein [Burkholderiaceae bacterium]
MLRLILLFATLVVMCMGAQAQSDYPNKPIRLIVPYVAGGAADITARVVAQKMTESMGQSVVVENKPGANGMLGTDIVSKSAPDGYTLLLAASGPIVVNPVLYAKVPYDAVNDLAPVSQITSFQYAVVVTTSSPIQSMNELIAMAKAKPKQVSYGSTGIGGGGHLAGELLSQITGAQLTHIPYKGAAPALADLLGGQLTFTFEPIVTAGPLVKAGKLRVFAVSGPKRASSLPQLPTLNELGFTGFNITQFQGVLAPAKTDPAIIARLHQEIVKASKSMEAGRRLVDEGGNEIIASSPAEFARQIKSDLALYGKLIKDAAIKPE